MQLFNTLSGKKETFVPLNPDHIKMYVCGPTVYDFAHIGNARPAVMFDILYRLLTKQYKKVSYARNITDIDDKINNAAKEQGVEIGVITKKTEAYFKEDMASLNVLEPTYQPRATETIPEMISMIQALVNKKHAYAAEGHVLFDVNSFDDYGALSKRSLDDMIAGARVEVAPYKKNAHDFVLWKPSSNDQPGWESPWGYGRPGWHIECSAMIEKHLETPIDIHAGGHDLVFPHHENEIAQGTCAHDGQLYSKYWMHNGMIQVEGKKMSKSLGNFFTVRDLLSQYSGEIIRLTILSTHYRQPLNWTKDALEQSKNILNKFKTALAKIDSAERMEFEPRAEFLDALEDDLNTPAAISLMHECVGELNKADENSKERLASELLTMGWYLGLFEQMEASLELSEDEIKTLVEQRDQAKKSKDWAKADQIRDDLKNQGILLEDGHNGTTWRAT